MYPGLFNYCRRQKITVQDPPFPLVVIMFRTQDEFDSYRATPPGIVADDNALSNHIVMYGHPRLADILRLNWPSNKPFRPSLTRA